MKAKISALYRRFMRSIMKRHISAKRVTRMTLELEQLNKKIQLLKSILQIKESRLRRMEENDQKR